MIALTLRHGGWFRAIGFRQKAIPHFADEHLARGNSDAALIFDLGPSAAGERALPPDRAANQNPPQLMSILAPWSRAPCSSFITLRTVKAISRCSKRHQARRESPTPLRADAKLSGMRALPFLILSQDVPILSAS